MSYREWKDNTFFNYFMILQTMLKPVQVIELQSLSDFTYYVNANRQTTFDFLTCLDTSSFSVVEAEECYQAILTFPRKGTAYDIKNNKISVNCPLSAQYWFVSLVTKSRLSNKEMHQWQLKKLREVPQWLLDFSESYRNPMDWLIKLCLEDSEKINILLSKKNKLLKLNLEKEFGLFQNKKYLLDKLLVQNETFPNFDISEFPKEQHSLVIALQKLDSVLQKYQPNIAHARHLGNSPEKIAQLDKLLGKLNLAEDIKVLYRWFNGSDFSMLFSPYGISSLEDAFLKIGDYESKAWFVIMDSENPVISILSESKQNHSPLYVLDEWQKEIYLAHESVLSMVQCFTEAYEKQVIQDNNDWITYNEKQFEQIQLKYSPSASIFDDEKQTRIGKFYNLNDPSTWLPEWKNFLN